MGHMTSYTLILRKLKLLFSLSFSSFDVSNLCVCLIWLLWHEFRVRCCSRTLQMNQRMVLRRPSIQCIERYNFKIGLGMRRPRDDTVRWTWSNVRDGC